MSIDGAGLGAVNNRLVMLHGKAEGGSGLSCQADDGVAIGSVVGDLKIHDGIIVADDFVNILADFAGLFDDEDTVGDGVGEVILGKAQLFQTAQHTVALYDFAFYDI